MPGMGRQEGRAWRQAAGELLGTGGSEVARHCPGREKAAAQTTLGLWGQTRWKQMPLDGGLLSCFDHLLRVASPQSHFSRLQRCYGC